MSDDTVPVLYSDGLRVNLSPATITLEFTQAQHWAVDEPERVLTRIKVSPLHFKLVAHSLNQLVEQYEGNFGEISTEGMQFGINFDPDAPESEQQGE